jgi:hypothetical protein
MRFVSQHSNYVSQIRPMRTRALGDGGVETTIEPIYAVFTPIEQGGFLYENEKDAAIRHFDFHGLTQHEMRLPRRPDLPPLDLRHRRGGREAGRDAEMKLIVEEALTNSACMNPQYLRSSSPRRSGSFLTYDTYTGDLANSSSRSLTGTRPERVPLRERTFSEGPVTSGAEPASDMGGGECQRATSGSPVGSRVRGGPSRTRSSDCRR